MTAKKKLIRITTVPMSLGGLLEGQLHFMDQHFDVVGISSGGKILERVGQVEGVRVIPIEMTRKITPFNDLRALWKLYRIFRKERPFIVHSHTPKAGTLSMLAAKMAGVPHRLHTIAGMPLLEATGYKRKLLNAVEWITYRCATGVYPNSNNMKNIARDLGFAPDEKLNVLGNGSSNGIDTSFFDSSLISHTIRKELERNLGISDEHFVFCYVGRLVRDKGIHELISAFVRVHEEFSNARLLLVGPYEEDLDPLDSQTEYAIKTMDSILDVGWQDDVRPFMAISDCFVFPSYREGFPNVVMQSGAMGLFTIASDINGCNEIIVDGQNGTLIPPKDVVSLYKKMKNQITYSGDRNPDLYRELIKSRFERKYVWQQILFEYQRLEVK